jgi:hypothetical protein
LLLLLLLVVVVVVFCFLPLIHSVSNYVLINVDCTELSDMTLSEG